MTTASVSSYANPEVLAGREWLEKNLNNPNVRILEIDYDPEYAYKQGHIPNAHLVLWKKDINDPIRRDIISKQHFEQLLSNIGATPETELVLYGDFNSWFASICLLGVSVLRAQEDKNLGRWTKEVGGGETRIHEG